MRSRISIAVILTLAATTVFAADKALVLEFMKMSGLRAEMEQNIRNSHTGLSRENLDKFISLVDFKKIEESYVSSMASGLSNEEIRALIKAAEIPGYLSASRKQFAVSGPFLKTIVGELERAAIEFRKNLPPVP